MLGLAVGGSAPFLRLLLTPGTTGPVDPDREKGIGGGGYKVVLFTINYLQFTAIVKRNF